MVARQYTRAGDVLDADHPLSRADARLTVAGERCLVLSVVLVVGVVALVDELSIGVCLTVAAAIVLAAQLGQVGVLSGTRNRRAVELIAQGRGDVPIEAVERVRRHLLHPGHRARLARTLDEIRGEIERPPSCRVRPLYRVRVLRPVVSEIAEVAALVRGEGGERGVARTELLITDGRSPLYGDGEELLRQELARIRFLLASEPCDSSRLLTHRRAR